MKPRASHALRKLSLTVLVGALSLTTVAPVFAQCDPAVLQDAQRRQQERLQREMQHAENVYRGHMNQPDWLKDSDGLLTACMSNNWPKVQVSQPMLQKILSGAQERATKEACNRARNAIAQQTGSYQDVLRSYPGYQNIQGGSNGNFGNWSQIGDLTGTTLPPTSNNPGVSLGDLPGFGGGNVQPGGPSQPGGSVRNPDTGIPGVTRPIQ